MDVQIVECTKIEEFAGCGGKELRSFKREFAVRLAESIKTEGLLQPIVIRPNPDKPGYYLRVAGKHRLYAMQKILKEQFIECNVLLDFDAKDHEMSLIAENLWRNPLTKDQQALSIKKWYEYFASKHGQRSALEVAKAKKTKAANVESAQAEEQKQLTDQSGIDAGAASDADIEAAEAKAAKERDAEFVEHVAESTGMAKRTAQRQVRIAKMFNEDELETFRQCYVTQEDQERISRVKDATERAQIISLIASGMAVEDAFKEVLREEAPKAAHAERAMEAKAKAEAKEAQTPAQSDDEWYECNCGEKAALIAADHTKYKNDAIFYRAIMEARNVFHAKLKKILAAHRRPVGQNGPLYYHIKKTANLSGPKDWFLCSGCSSTGAVDGQKCPECFGAGYKIKSEEY